MSEGVTATIKWGKGYEAPWLVFNKPTPDETKHAVAEAFGMESYEGLTLAEVTFEATNIAQAMGSVGQELGGRVLGKSASESKPDTTDYKDPWVAAEETPAAPEKTLADLIAEQTSVDALKLLYVEHKAELTDPANAELFKAWSEKGKALKAAGA